VEPNGLNNGRRGRNGLLTQCQGGEKLKLPLNNSEKIPCKTGELRVAIWYDKDNKLAIRSTWMNQTMTALFNQFNW
jgi:hypothetical protein